MNRNLVFASFLFFSLMVANKAFALHDREVPEDLLQKKEGRKWAIYNRVIFDNTLSDHYQFTDSKDQYKNADARFDLVSKVVYDKNWSLNFNYRFQELVDQSSEIQRRNALAQGGGDKTYENHFGLTRELYLAYDNDKIKVFGGKFRPGFGRSWSIGRGIWTHEFGSDYNQLERLGGGFVLKAGDKKTIGAYQLGFSSFTNDTKNLDNTQITTRDPSSKTSGNAGDARGFSSYNVHLDINFDFGKKEKLFYRFAYNNLATNSNQAINRLAANKIEDQKGYSASMIYKKPISQNFSTETWLEFVDIKNFNGDGDVSNQYSNANAILTFYENWNTTLAFSNQKNLHYGQNGYDETFSEISAGYTFKNKLLFDKLQLQIGHKTLRTNYKNDLDEGNVWGVMLRYAKWF